MVWYWCDLTGSICYCLKENSSPVTNTRDERLQLVLEVFELDLRCTSNAAVSHVTECEAVIGRFLWREYDTWRKVFRSRTERGMSQVLMGSVGRVVESGTSSSLLLPPLPQQETQLCQSLLHLRDPRQLVLQALLLLLRPQTREKTGKSVWWWTVAVIISNVILTETADWLLSA